MTGAGHERLEAARSGRPSRRPAALVAFVALTGLSYAPAIFGPPFYTKGEPREAVVVARMVESGDFVLPHRTQTELPAKPPLFHWLGATASRLMGGVSESSVRFPSLAASLLVLVLTVLAGGRVLDSTTAWTAAIALATSQQWIASSVTARVDMVLAASISIAMFGFIVAHTRGARWPNLFWFGCSLAVLAKGPVGVAVPFLCTIVFLVWQRDIAYVRTIRPLHAAFALSIALAWYVIAWHRAGDVFLHKVLSENVYRMVDVDAGDDLGHRHSSLYYLPALLGGLAPWSLLLPAVVIDIWHERRSLDGPRVFAIVWVLATVGFFSLAGSKRPVYLLSCYPAASLLIGAWLSKRFRQETDTRVPLPATAAMWGRVFAAVLVIVGAVLALQSAGAPILDGLRLVTSPGDAANLVPAALSLEAHRALVLPWFVALIVAACVSSRAVSEGAWRVAFATVAILVAGTTWVFAATVFRDVAETQSVKPFIEAAAAHVTDRAPLFYYAGARGEPELYFFKAFEYAAGFYGGRPLTALNHVEIPEGESVWFITAEPTLERLKTSEANRDGDRDPPSFRVLSRFTYGDNPRRTPVVFVEARRD